VGKPALLPSNFKFYKLDGSYNSSKRCTVNSAMAHFPGRALATMAMHLRDKSNRRDYFSE